ncbi:MAG: hypothetical protein ACXW1Q_03685 [Halobacteriota archaeon]
MLEVAELERLTGTIRSAIELKKAHRLNLFQFSPLKSFYIEVQTYKKMQTFSGGYSRFHKMMTRSLSKLKFPLRKQLF